MLRVPSMATESPVGYQQDDTSIDVQTATGNAVVSGGLTIKTATNTSSKGPSELPSPNLKNSNDASPYNSPLVSPPSSAFVSALQSPYISPRALTPKPPPSENTTPPIGHPSPVVSDKGPQSDDIPSSSYTPPSELYEYSDFDPIDQKHKFVTDTAPPRISFSFQVPKISFTKGPVSPTAANAKLRTCDVYIGFHGQHPNLLRFCRWLKSELELQGIACFVADRSKYTTSQRQEIADRVICSVTFGLVVVTNTSFLSPLSIEEIRFFAQKKNLIPLLFDTGPEEIIGLLNCHSLAKACKEAVEGVVKCHEWKLEAAEGNWRSCVSKAAGILRARLGRKSVDERDIRGSAEELPFSRNRYLLGRDKEIMEIEGLFFRGGEQDPSCFPVTRGEASGQSDGFADGESDSVTIRGERFISLEIGSKSKEPNLEAWVEPAARNSFKSLKQKQLKKSKGGNFKKSLGGRSVICINGVAGIGKSELALEFAYRYWQRYKMVLWVGGEARYLRQNILNLSQNLGLDVSADSDRERGPIRSFEEQETEAFKRIKRELFRDVPYLLIIDNLESEREWWEGKDLGDLIPRNTGGTHVIITTRLSKVMNYDTMQLPPLPLPDAMILIKGRKRKEYPADEIEFLRKFDERLKRCTFGLWLVGSLLSELSITPSALFNAINPVMLEAGLPPSPPSYMSPSEEQYRMNNPFLMKILNFSFTILEQSGRKRKGKGNSLATQMLLVGGWFAPTAISASLLAAAAKHMPAMGHRFKKWGKCMRLALRCCSGCVASRTWECEEDSSALVLVKLGLAQRANKHSGCWVQFHSITRAFAKRKGGSESAQAMVQGLRRINNPLVNADHLWASAFLVFGFKSELPHVQLKAVDMVLYVKRTALPLAIQAFTAFSRCSSALELLKVCTNVLEEVEKSFVSQIQDWYDGSLCWKKRLLHHQSGDHTRVDEDVWQDVTLLKATLLETRAKLLMRGGHLVSGEELCRTCISIRTVMLGHNHAQTLAAQETLTKLVRMRSKII